MDGGWRKWQEAGLIERTKHQLRAGLWLLAVAVVALVGLVGGWREGKAEAFSTPDDDAYYHFADVLEKDIG